MIKKIAIYMDDINSINTKKDTSFAMGLETQRRGWELYYFQQEDMFLEDGEVYANVKKLSLIDSITDYYTIEEEKIINLTEIDCILIRKEPPFDREYMYSTQLLDLVEKQGTLVINRPQALRDFNEKLAISNFPNCIAPTMVSKSKNRLQEFLEKHKDVVVKPLDGFAGKSVFVIKENDLNKNVIIETVTNNFTESVMIQKYIPQIKSGDKRVILINGEPIPYAYARVPSDNDCRGNLACGGTGVGVKLTEKDLFICKEIGSKLKKMGLVFVGIDIIGDYLTEINITSPTCVRELNKLYGLNILEQLFDYIDNFINSKRIKYSVVEKS